MFHFILLDQINTLIAKSTSSVEQVIVLGLITFAKFCSLRSCEAASKIKEDASIFLGALLHKVMGFLHYALITEFACPY